jgi:hypothetical protein
MSNPTAEQTKSIDALSNVVNSFVGAINQKLGQSLTSATVNSVSGYSFESPVSVMQQKYTAIAQSIDALMQVDAQTAGPLKAEWDSLKQPMNDEFNKLLSTKGFSQTLWENNFKNINAAIATATASLPANPDLAAISASINNFQTDVIYQEIERLNRSVNNQKISFDSMQRGEQIFGAGFKKDQMWKRYDPVRLAEYETPQPGTAGAFKMSGVGDNPGIGMDGYYRRENSNYIIQLKEGAITATYSQKETNYIGAVKALARGDTFGANKAWDESQEARRRKQSFSGQIKESIEALVVLTGVKSVVFDYPGQNNLSKYHIKNIETAIAQAQAMIDKKIANNGKGIGVDFDLGPTAMGLLMSSTSISDSRRQAILDSLKNLHADYGKAANLEAANTPAPAQQTASAPAQTSSASVTPTGAATTTASTIPAGAATPTTAATNPAGVTASEVTTPDVGGISSEPTAAPVVAPEPDADPSFEPLVTAGISSVSTQESAPKNNSDVDDLINDEDLHNDSANDNDDEHNNERPPTPSPGNR